MLRFGTEELQQRDELIRVLTRRVCVVETREEEAQKQLSELEHKRQHLSHRCQDFEVFYFLTVYSV